MKGCNIPRTVIHYLGACALISLAACFWLLHTGKDAGSLEALAAGATGALGSILASTRTQSPTISGTEGKEW